MNTKRIIYLDMLKIISCIAVVLIHATSIGYYALDIHTASWNATIVFNIISRFAVPVFVMVSGALFLNNDKKIDIKRLYSKNILRLVVIYIVWTLIYSVYNVYNKGIGLGVINVLKDGITKSYYHLWFIPMLIGVYMCIPLLKPIVKDKKLVEYFLIIFVLFKILPTTIQLFKFPYSGYIGNVLARIDIPMLSYIGYFILGHYLHTYELSKKTRKIIYISGAIATVTAVLGTIFYSLHVGAAKETLCREFSITTYIMSISIYVLVKYLINSKKIKFERVIIHMSNISLGIYLTHALFRDILKNQLGVSFTNIWNLPLNTLIMIVASYILSYALSKIPVVNKYII